MTAPVVIHLRNQDDQPYGSERRCCSRCGTALLGAEPKWVEHRAEYESLPAGYVRCDAVSRRKIPGKCRVCGQSLSRLDMESWLLTCERLEVDPVEQAFKHEPPGAPCDGCVRQNFVELYADGHPAARAAVAREVLRQRGFEVLDGGRAPEGGSTVRDVGIADDGGEGNDGGAA